MIPSAQWEPEAARTAPLPAALAADAWDREALTWAWSRGLLPETADWSGPIPRSQGEALAELVEGWT